MGASSKAVESGAAALKALPQPKDAVYAPEGRVALAEVYADAMPGVQFFRSFRSVSRSFDPSAASC